MHVSWADIVAFHVVRRAIVKVPHIVGGRPSVSYRSKVKLHGTNAGVRVNSDGKVQAFSRTSLISPDCDNEGFAKWVEARKEAFSSMARKDRDFVIYGEWCGPGIQKGVACSKIPQRIFAVFAVRYLNGDMKTYECEPCELSPFVDGIDGAYVIPWYRDGEVVMFDYTQSAEELELALSKVNDWVADVENCDPWIKSTFGIEGLGEGLVFYPCRPHSSYDDFSNLAFKAKGLKHRVVAHNKPVQSDPTVVAGAQAFAELVLPEARLEQGAKAVSGDELRFEPRLIGPFMAWIGKDVVKECSTELEASGLTWKDVNKHVTDHARKWYLEKVKST